MVNHIVLFKLKKGTLDSDKNNLYNEFLDLKNSIPGIVSISGGDNISTEGLSRDYSLAFSLVFKNIDYRDKYLPHIKHKKLVDKYIKPIVEDVLVFDYKL